MKYLVVTSNTQGHFMEYLHHIAVHFDYFHHELYMGVSDSMQGRLSLLQWPDERNLHWLFIDEKKVRTHHPIIDSYQLTRETAKLCRNVEPDHILFLELMSVMPFGLYLLPRNVKISGILYNIYLYSWKRDGVLKKALNALKMIFMVKSHALQRAFILNDKVAPILMNRIWHTKKFHFLTDPYVAFGYGGFTDIRRQYHISSSKTLFIHLGNLSLRKGTLTIFDIIADMSDSLRQQSCFIIAGKVEAEIIDDFYSLYKQWNEKVQLLIFDQFCSYEFFCALCKAGDYMVLPYKETCCSSGLIAYAAQFNTPVIIPAGGMVPKLVRRYRIGIVLNGDFVKSFIDALPGLIDGEVKNTNDYIREHTIEKFIYDIALPSVDS